MSGRIVRITLVFVVMTVSAVLPVAPWAATAHDPDIIVHVTKRGAEFSVTVDCPVEAPIEVVWSVLIDYDHMSQFISNLDVSTVRKRDGNRLTVYQRGKATHGPLTYEFENVREVLLVASREIRSRSVTGNLKSGVFSTKIVEVGGSVHILHTGQYSPKSWVPPLVGPALIESETRRQFSEIRNESVRRRQSSAGR